MIKRLDVEEIVLYWEELKVLYGYLSSRTIRRHDLFNSLSECILLGLFDGDQLLGVCSLYLNNGPWGPFGRIENVAVDENHRGKGYGKLLVKDALERAKNAGTYRCELACSEAKRDFYQKCGMEQVAISMKRYFEN